MAWDHCGRREPHSPHPYTAYFNEGPYDLTCGGTARPVVEPMEVADERTLASLLPGAEPPQPIDEDTLAAIEDIAFGRGERVADWPEDEREAWRAASDLTRALAVVQRRRAEKILALVREQASRG